MYYTTNLIPNINLAGRFTVLNSLLHSTCVSLKIIHVSTAYIQSIYSSTHITVLSAYKPHPGSGESPTLPGALNGGPDVDTPSKIPNQTIEVINDIPAVTFPILSRQRTAMKIYYSTYDA